VIPSATGGSSNCPPTRNDQGDKAGGAYAGSSGRLPDGKWAGAYGPGLQYSVVAALEPGASCTRRGQEGLQGDGHDNGSAGQER
jgi:hypothetical protein